jgi:hypothetical protein
VLRLCDKIMGEKFRAVFLQYRLLKSTHLLTISFLILVQFMRFTLKVLAN